MATGSGERVSITNVLNQALYRRIFFNDMNMGYNKTYIWARMYTSSPLQQQLYVGKEASLPPVCLAN